MLTKLLKYELKATGRVFLPLFLALLIFAGINRIFTPLNPEIFDTSAIISMGIYFIIMVGMFVMAFIMMIQRFYKNLLSDEGYLMLTLPVKPWKHILSKLLVSMLWVISSCIVAFISIVIIALRGEALPEISRRFSFAYQQILAQYGDWIYLFAFEALISILITLASGILLFYASMAIGQLFNQHKMLASFAAFVALNTLAQIFTSVVTLLPARSSFAHLTNSPNNFMTMQPVLQTVILYSILLTGIMSVAYFFIINYILSKRLNLE